jgi:hypothetical protein
VIGLHPREDPELWRNYEISDASALSLAASSELVVGIPGTIFPAIAASGTPLIGCVTSGLSVPDYLLSVCWSLIADADNLAPAFKEMRTPTAKTISEVVGPIGDSARRLLGVWQEVAALGSVVGPGG